MSDFLDYLENNPRFLEVTRPRLAYDEQANQVAPSGTLRIWVRPSDVIYAELDGDLLRVRIEGMFDGELVEVVR